MRLLRSIVIWLLVLGIAPSHSQPTGAPADEDDPVEFDIGRYKLEYDPSEPRFRVVQLDTYDNLNNGVVDSQTGTGHNLKGDGEIICNYELRGGIQKGDYAQFYALLEQNRHRHGTNSPRLCLDSSGGDRRNALSIAQLLISEKIGTAVPDNALCLSGCAFIFLGGSHAGKGELNRFLHVGGRLGFHAPHLYKMPPGRPGDDFTTREVMDAYETAVDAIKSIAKLGVGNDVNRLPSELFEALMDRGPDEFHYVDTVGKAIRFRIHLYGKSVRPKLETASFCNACVNIDYGAWEGKGRGEVGDRCAAAGPVEEEAFPLGTRMTFPFADGNRCVVDVEMKDGKISGWVWTNSGQPWARGWRLSYWYLYPPNTTFKSLRGMVETCYGSRGHLIHLDDRETKPIHCTLPVIDPKMVRFVRDTYLGHQRRNHVVRAALLDEQMNYYGAALSRAEVLKKRDAYYARWPERYFEIVDGSMWAARFPKFTDAETDFEHFVVGFEYNFTVRRNDDFLEGRGTITLKLKPAGDSFIIWDETGEVTKRK